MNPSRAEHHFGLVPVGNVDGATYVYTLPSVPEPGSVRVFVGGQRLYPESDYSVTGRTLRLRRAPPTGSPPLVDYVEGSQITGLPQGSSPSAVSSYLVSGTPPNGAAGGDLAGTYPNPTVTQARGLRETGGPTTLAIGSVPDLRYLIRSGTSIIGVTIETPTWVCYVANPVLVAALVRVGAVTDSKLGEFIFGGTNDFTGSAFDEFTVHGSTVGTGTSTVRIRDTTNSNTLAEVSFGSDDAGSAQADGTFASIPVGAARMEFQATVPAGQTLTVNCLAWVRRR